MVAFTLNERDKRIAEIDSRLAAINAEQSQMENDAEQKGGGKFTPEARKRYDQLSGEYGKLKAEQDELKRRRRAGWGGRLKTGQTPPDVPTVQDGDRRSYAGMFAGKVDLEDTGDFEDAGEFFQVLASGQFDPRMKNLAGNYEYSDPDGGFVVPPSFSTALLDMALEQEIVRPMARVVPMTTREMDLPRWDGYDHSSGVLYGGLTAKWTGEAESLTAQSGKLEKMTLNAHRLVLFSRASNQLLEDAPAFGESMQRAISSSIAFRLDEAFLAVGTGTGQPLSLLNDPALITVSKETGQAAATIQYPNLAKMFARMYPAGRNRAVWVINNSAIPQLLQLTITIGTAGAHIPVMTESNGQFRILGRPVIFTEKVPTLGTVGDVLFVDFSQYVIGLRHDIRLAPSNQVYFASDETAFRGIVRVDGRGSWKSALTPKNGDTLSWVVTLATRA